MASGSTEENRGNNSTAGDYRGSNEGEAITPKMLLHTSPPITLT